MAILWKATSIEANILSNCFCSFYNSLLGKVTTSASHFGPCATLPDAEFRMKEKLVPASSLDLSLENLRPAPVDQQAREQHTARRPFIDLCFMALIMPIGPIVYRS